LTRRQQIEYIIKQTIQLRGGWSRVIKHLVTLKKCWTNSTLTPQINEKYSKGQIVNYVICVLGPLQTFSAQRVTFLVDQRSTNTGSMFGYVITRHTVVTRDQPPLIWTANVQWPTVIFGSVCNICRSLCAILNKLIRQLFEWINNVSMLLQCCVQNKHRSFTSQVIISIIALLCTAKEAISNKSPYFLNH